MQHANQPSNNQEDSGTRKRPSPGFRHYVGIVGFLLVAGYFLWTEHEAHIRTALPYLPWLLLLACPLIHVFMHGGHGGHGGHAHGDEDSGDGDDQNHEVRK